jgi:hypothetical protein
MSKYVSQINGSPIFATRAEYTKNGVDIDEALSGIANGLFEVVNLDPDTHEPAVVDPSHKIIYLTKESGSSKIDPYTEWIYTKSNTWEIIGETSIDLSGYKTMQNPYTASGLGAGKTITALEQNANGKISATAEDISITSSQISDKSDTYSSTGTTAVTGKAIAAALGTLDAAVTSSDGTNVQVKVTEADGKITSVNITTDNTENKNNKVTSWSSDPKDTKYPSEKLVKDTLDDKVDKVSGKGLSTNDYTTTEKNKLAGISEGANKVESSTTNGNIKIDGTETTVYTHPTTAGNKHIPTGGSSGQVLVYGGSSGTASWGNAPADNTKADKVASATSGDFAGLDSNGNLTDSGKKASDFATAAQGSKADSAIQGVKVNGTALTPDSSRVVDILPATSAAYGVVQLGYVDLE